MLTDRFLSQGPPARGVNRRCGLALLVALATMLGIPAMASATTIGTPDSGIVNRALLDTFNDFSVVEVAQPATVAGGVSVFDFYAGSTGTINIFIVDAAGTVKYITPDIAVTSTGAQSYDIGATQSVPIAVGDEIGYYTSTTGVIPYDQPGPAIGSTTDGAGKPTVGSTIANAIPGLARTYSLGATGVQTATAVASDGTPSQFGQPVTFTASSNITTEGMGNPTGTVDFTSGGASIGCDAQPIIPTIRPWTATCTTSALAVGPHQIVATYSGGPSSCCGTTDPYDFEGSTSPAITQVVLNTADLALTKTASPTPDVQHDQNVTYSLKVSNGGPGLALAPTVTDTLPAGQTFNAGLSSPGCTSTGAQTVTCTDADLPDGSSITDMIVAKAGTIGPNQTDTATVSSTTTDSQPANNTATASVNVVASADLSISKTASPNPVIAGQQLTYTLTVTNNGPDPAVNPVVKDTLPAGDTFQKEGTGGASSSCMAAGQNVTCSPGGTLGVGQTESVQILVLPSAASDTNTATVSSDTADPKLSNNTSTVTTTVSSSCTDTRANTRVNGSIVVASGQYLCLSGTTVTGSVLVDAGGGLTMFNSTIAGSLQSAGAQFMTICGSSLATGGGSVDIHGTVLLTRVGDDDMSPACPGNHIGGALLVHDNTGGVEVFGNTIGGAATVSTNSGGSPIADGTPEVEGNHVGASLECKANTPPPTDDGQPNTVGGAKLNQCAGL
jgi:uncharacterized repeat protein (TIGR01451 family)